MANITRLKKIFISHATKDREYVSQIVEFLQETLWIPASMIFCSSLPGYGVPVTDDFEECIKNQFHNFELYVIFMCSENFNNSDACISEIADTLQANSRYGCIILPPFGYEIVNEVLNTKKIAIRFSDNDEDMKKYRLKELVIDMGKWLEKDIADDVTINRAVRRVVQNIKVSRTNYDEAKSGQENILNFLPILARMPQPFSIDIISEASGYSRSTIRRKLEMYISQGYLRKMRSGRRVEYRLNYKIFEEQDTDDKKSYFFGFFENKIRGNAVYGFQGKLLREGKWKNQLDIYGNPSRKSTDLLSGIEYDWIVKREAGTLIWNKTEQDYDSDDLEYSKWLPLGDADYQFNWIEPQLEVEGLDDYYVADIRVDGSVEQLFHIRPLERYMEEKYPKKLAELKELME